MGPYLQLGHGALVQCLACPLSVMVPKPLDVIGMPPICPGWYASWHCLAPGLCSGWYAPGIVRPLAESAMPRCLTILSLLGPVPEVLCPSNAPIEPLESIFRFS